MVGGNLWGGRKLVDDSMSKHKRRRREREETLQLLHKALPGTCFHSWPVGCSSELHLFRVHHVTEGQKKSSVSVIIEQYRPGQCLDVLVSMMEGQRDQFMAKALQSSHLLATLQQLQVLLSQQ